VGQSQLSWPPAFRSLAASLQDLMTADIDERTHGAGPPLDLLAIVQSS
jgi:hypothetical protein